LIRLQLNSLTSVDDARSMLQTAIGVELGTLPPYLYALYSIPPGTNPQAEQVIRSVAVQEMIHLCLDCNILNALGGTPVVHPQKYPGPLPGDIGPHGTPLTIHLYPFSREALQQAMAIEQPENPPNIPVVTLAAAAPASKAVTIGQYYAALDRFLGTLPDTSWIPGRNQIVDDQFFPGRLFAVSNYGNAHRAISTIVSEGEGTEKGTTFNPLDFEDEVAHYFRFGEIYHDRVLTKTDSPEGYAWGPQRLGVNWAGVYPAIPDPGLHDFTTEPAEARAAQNACNHAFSGLVKTLQSTVRSGENGIAKPDGSLGQAVRAMYALRMAALHAFTVPLADTSKVAGPAFQYIPGSSEGGAA
jgi:hypothetical protein